MSKDRVALKARAALWAARLRVKPVQIRIQLMRRKWASCSANGRISLCSALLQQPQDFQDYVLVHELLHLRLRNHGKLFTRTLNAYLPGNPWVKRHSALA